MARARAQHDVEVILAAYEGLLISISAVMVELGKEGCIYSREAVRKWMVDYGCQPVSGRLYRVPMKGRLHGNSEPTTDCQPEPEPAPA